MTPSDSDELYSIGEVSDMVGQEAHVLRYWEQEFEVLSPQKNRAGRRVYSQADIDLVRHICHLLKEEMYTIAGARQALARQQEEEGRNAAFRAELREMRAFLQTVRDQICDGTDGN